MNKKQITHRELCFLAADWLHQPGRIHPASCPHVAVELVTATQERPDVFGWNSWATVMIEVKVSRVDFLADAKKHFRQHPDQGVGDFRFYCCPDGLIDIDEIPEEWGLLYEKDGVIRKVKDAMHQKSHHQSERTIFASMFRREVKRKIFDYRK
jgi:hypothetical protein